METCSAVSFVETIEDFSDPTFDQVYPHLPSHSNRGVPDCSEVVAPPPNVLHDCLGPADVAPIRHRASEEHEAPDPQFAAPIPRQAASIFA